jgi:nucleoid-associated protein YgaU
MSRNRSSNRASQISGLVAAAACAAIAGCEREVQAPDDELAPVAAEPAPVAEIDVVEVEAPEPVEAAASGAPDQPLAAEAAASAARAVAAPEAAPARLAAAAALPAVGAPPPARTYTVRPGDSLARIAREKYGDVAKLRMIYEANRDRIADPDHIEPGQELVLP